MFDSIRQFGILSLVIGLATAILAVGTSLLLKTVTTDYTDLDTVTFPVPIGSDTAKTVMPDANTEIGFFTSFNYYAQTTYDSPTAAVMDAIQDPSIYKGSNQVAKDTYSALNTVYKNLADDRDWVNARYPMMIVLTLQAMIASVVVVGAASHKGLKVQKLSTKQMLGLSGAAGVVTVAVGMTGALLMNRMFDDYTDARYTMFPLVDNLGFLQALSYYPRTMYKSPLADVRRSEQALFGLCKRLPKDKDGKRLMWGEDDCPSDDDIPGAWNDATIPVAVITIVQTTLAAMAVLSIAKHVPGIVRP